MLGLVQAQIRRTAGNDAGPEEGGSVEPKVDFACSLHCQWPACTGAPWDRPLCSGIDRGKAPELMFAKLQELTATEAQDVEA